RPAALSQQRAARTVPARAVPLLLPWLADRHDLPAACRNLTSEPRIREPNSVCVTHAATLPQRSLQRAHGHRTIHRRQPNHRRTTAKLDAPIVIILPRLARLFAYASVACHWRMPFRLQPEACLP